MNKYTQNSLGSHFATIGPLGGIGKLESPPAPTPSMAFGRVSSVPSERALGPSGRKFLMPTLLLFNFFISLFFVWKYGLLCSCRLSQLRILSVNNNQLTQLPLEICAVSALEELYVANNQLTSLPVAIGCLTKLSRLHAQKNKLRELPEVLASVIIYLYLTYIFKLKV